MASKLKPAAFRLLDSCTKTCSLSAWSLGPKVAELVHSWFEAGCNNATISARARQIDVSISEGACGRHRANHLEMIEQFEDSTDGGEGPPAVDDIVLLDQVIARGAESLRFKTARVTTEQLLKAMELKYKLSAGSVWEKTLMALGGAMADSEDDEGPEDTAAIGSEDELGQAGE